MPKWLVKVGWNTTTETFETNGPSAIDAAEAALELVYTCVDRQDEWQVERVAIEVTPR